MSTLNLAAAVAQAQESVARHESQNAGDPFHFRLTEHRYVALRDLLAALSTPPADDVRRCSNAECPLDYAHDGPCAPKGWAPPADDVRDEIATLACIANRHDGGGPQCEADYDVADAFLARYEVRPHGTVTDAEVVRALAEDCDCEDREALVRPEGLVCGTCGKVIEAAREVHP